jgi:hypothetical protein
MIKRTIVSAVAAVALVLSLATGASAYATPCGILSPTKNVAGSFCADATFATGQGRIYWKLQLLNTNDPVKVELYSKTGTFGWVLRGSDTTYNGYVSGFIGFATPTNTAIQVKVINANGGVSWWSVPQDQA